MLQDRNMGVTHAIRSFLSLAFFKPPNAIFVPGMYFFGFSKYSNYIPSRQQPGPGAVGPNVSLPKSRLPIQFAFPCSRRNMKNPRLNQSSDQRDRGDWARSYCPRFPLTYDIGHSESILEIRIVHKPSQYMDCARTLKRLAPFLASPTLQLSVNVATIEFNDAFCLQTRKAVQGNRWRWAERTILHRLLSLLWQKDGGKREAQARNERSKGHPRPSNLKHTYRVETRLYPYLKATKLL